MNCPHCQREVVLAKLPHPGLFASYRICPGCKKRFTVDPMTRRRQALALALATVSLILTILMYFDGAVWLVPALASYAILAGVIVWGNRLVALVRVDD